MVGGDGAATRANYFRMRYKYTWGGQATVDKPDTVALQNIVGFPAQTTLQNAVGVTVQPTLHDIVGVTGSAFLHLKLKNLTSYVRIWCCCLKLWFEVENLDVLRWGLAVWF